MTGIERSRITADTVPVVINLGQVLTNSVTNQGQCHRGFTARFLPSMPMLQAFDGPAPETINGRSAMIGVLVALIYEFRTGKDCVPLPHCLFAVA